MTTPFERILPKKTKYPVAMLRTELTDYGTDMYNSAIDDCHAALNKAIKDGVIGFVPNLSQLSDLATKCIEKESDGGWGVNINLYIKSIRELMVRK